mmetsp:Transcript_52072/g.117299  ORF Transcript_52072/g.117299 Transcript_52072/m.117299 type:complete len:221 (-) Transcript_52072:28-690(-)
MSVVSSTLRPCGTHSGVKCEGRHSELAALRDEHREAWLAARAHGDVLNLAHHEHGGRVQHLAEHHVLVVQPVALVARDEELAAVGVGAAVGHGEQAGLVVLEDEVLVGEPLPEDAQTACAVALHEVASLNHEVLDDSVESTVLVANGHLVQLELPSAQLPEVLCCLRHHVTVELHLYAAHGVASDGDVEEYHRVVRVPLRPVLCHLSRHLAAGQRPRDRG